MKKIFNFIILAAVMALTVNAAFAQMEIKTKQTNDSKAIKQCLDSIVTPNSGKDVYSYDKNGNNTLYISYHWNTEINNWKEASKYEFTYDNNNNRTLQIYYQWNTEINNWKESSKTEYTYDNNNNQTSYIEYSWNTEINNWKESNKGESTYDNNNNRTLQIGYSWNTEINNWIESQKYEYTYDNNNNQTLQISYQWNTEINNWKESQKREYTYDNNNNQTSFIYHTWNSGNWIGSKNEYKYNLSYSSNELVSPSVYGVNMLTEATSYTWSGSAWVENNVTTYYWSGKDITPSSIEELGMGNYELSVYPNPTNGIITVVVVADNHPPLQNDATIQIYDISGRVVQTQFIASQRNANGNNIPLDISHLQQGMYYLKIGNETVKIIKN